MKIVLSKENKKRYWKTNMDYSRSGEVCQPKKIKCLKIHKKHTENEQMRRKLTYNNKLEATSLEAKAAFYKKS